MGRPGRLPGGRPALQGRLGVERQGVEQQGAEFLVLQDVELFEVL